MQGVANHWKSIILGIAAVATGIVIFYILFLSQTFARYPGLLPYHLNNKVNKTITDYLKTRPAREVLLYSSPYKSGKHTIASLFQVSMLNKGHLPIVIDFSPAKNTEEIFSFARLSLLRSFNLAKNSIYFETIKQSLSTTTQTDIYIDPALSSLYISLSNAIDEARNATSGVYNFIDTLEGINKTLNVALFVVGTQKLEKFAPHVLNGAISRLSSRNLYMDHVPVIAFSTDTSRKNIPNLFRQLQLPEEEDPYRFVDGVQAFTKAEMKRLISNVGVHGGEFEYVFEALKIGTPISQAIEDRFQAVNASVSQLCPECKKLHLMKRLCRAQKVQPLATFAGSEAAEELMKAGYIIVTPESTLRFANGLVRRSVCSK